MRTHFIPVMLLALAFLLVNGFQAHSLLQEREAMAATRGAQEAPLGNANKLRQSLDTVVSEVRRLAGEGNGNAKAILETFERRGVHFGAAPNAAPAKPPGESGVTSRP
jgi:hypothetical protein